MLIYFLLPLIAVALLCVPFIFTAKKIKNGKSPKGAFIGMYICRHNALRSYRSCR